MTTKEVHEGNELIAEFMNMIKHPYRFYHSYWDWLMPVVEKIESLEGGKMYSFFIVQHECDIAFSSKYDDKGNDIDAPNFKQSKKTKIESTWYACVEFIKWWNKKI